VLGIEGEGLEAAGVNVEVRIRTRPNSRSIQ
jgi:hypothetical protein